MSSIYGFQMSGVKALWFKIAMKMLARRLQFLCPRLYHGFVGSGFHRTEMNSLGELNLALFQVAVYKEDRRFVVVEFFVCSGYGAYGQYSLLSWYVCVKARYVH